MQSNSEQPEIQSISEPEQKNDYDYYYDLCVEPYYIAGLAYTTWNSTSEIDSNELLTFYTYNAYFDTLKKLLTESPEKYADSENINIDASDVEEFIQSYFYVDEQYLRKADAYDEESNTYQFPKTDGIGGGPGLEITDIKTDEESNITTIFCKDVSDIDISIVIEFLNEDQFRYIAGTCSTD